MTLFYITLAERDNTPEEPVGGCLLPDFDTAVSRLDQLLRDQPEKSYQLMAVGISLGKPRVIVADFVRAARGRNERKASK